MTLKQCLMQLFFKCTLEHIITDNTPVVRMLNIHDAELCSQFNHHMNKIAYPNEDGRWLSFTSIVLYSDVIVVHMSTEDDWKRHVRLDFDMNDIT